jgi:hypothetical protein
MMTRSATALTALLAAAGLAAAGLVAGGGYGVPAGDGGRAAAAATLHCGSVVDPAGYQQGPLTASLAVASLTALGLADGAAGPPGGAAASAGISTLDTMAAALMGYSGTRLAADAQAFAVTELNYSPGGPVDASYARSLGQSVRALQRDCPGGMKLGLRWRNEASESPATDGSE